MKPVSWVQILSLVLLILIGAGLASSEWSMQLDRMDALLMQHYFGEERAANIRAEVRKACVDMQSGTGRTTLMSGFRGEWDSADDFTHSSPELEILAHWGEERFVLLDSLLQRVVQRTLILLAFAPVGVLLFIVFLLDGVMQWKVKQLSFAYSSPLAHRATLLAFVGLIALLMLAILAPIPFFPGLIPIHLGLLAWCLRSHVTHLPKRL